MKNTCLILHFKELYLDKNERQEIADHIANILKLDVAVFDKEVTLHIIETIGE